MTSQSGSAMPEHLSPIRIAVIGASGRLGGAIAREALARGHEVTAVARHPKRLAKLGQASSKIADATDVGSLEQAISGHEVAVVSVTARSSADRSTIPAAVRALIEAVSRAGVPRLAVVGGGGTLLTPPDAAVASVVARPNPYLPADISVARGAMRSRRAGL
jgi:uncharacterized protein